MRTIIAGSRTFKSDVHYHILDGLLEYLNVSVVISGGCSGVDALGERWAIANGASIERYPADWDKYEAQVMQICNDGG